MSEATLAPAGRNTELEFRRLLETLPAGAYTCDPDGLITYFNQHAVRLWGRAPKLNDPADRFCGSFKLFAADGSPLTHDQCWMALALRTEREYNGHEVVIERADGERRTALAHANPIHDESGKLIGAVNVLVDITERKRTQEALAQAQRMEAVGRLAGGIAHDLNNMLVVILGYADFATRRMDQLDPGRDDLEQIKKAASRSASLTAQLLAFARRDLIQPRRVDLSALVRDSEQMLRALLGENIDLELKLAEDPGWVLADAGRIEQVLLNLVLNARDAMPQGGHLTLETSRTTIDQSYLQTRPAIRIEPGDYIMLAVSDSGHGMDRATLERSFEPFFTTKPVGRGTGLGLAMVYGAVKQAGGMVWAYSEPGLGAVVKAYLPVATDSETRESGEAAHQRRQPSGETVLLVEDEPQVRELAARALQEAGYLCLAASSGAEALGLLREHTGPIDLVFSDAVMPGMSGCELAERVRLIRPDLEMLFSSGYTEDDVLRRGLIRPGSPFLQKPFSPEGLVERVGAILDERALRAP
jgi:two-component system, cell cycle sensor histidine kinase and response regulator CckA